VNIMQTVTSVQGRLRGLAIVGVSLALAACGSSQNWSDKSEYVTIGGTVSGFTGGTLALWNNGADRLPIAADGSFQFPLSIANGDGYTVVVATQPAGQTCTVANGIGQARGNVKDVKVSCVPYSFTQRPLPAIYSTGKAINYSPYRTPRGPLDFEVPTDSQILEDLALLHAAGYNLLRLFGAETPARDVVAEKILSLAEKNYPEMRFHLGVALGGLTSCSDPKNDYNIAYLISNLSRYPNVVAISVGNETSFYSKFMPLACLESYVRTIRSQVTQPVTADDDWTFYAGKSSGGGDRVEVKPDTILALIDFASIHMYPISNTTWNWQQTSVPAGPARAQAMMEESLRAAKDWFGEVADYQYRGASGVTVSVADSMPIVIGETGWKAVQTNPGSQIESYAALPVNQKWYVDLLYGGNGYPSWQGSAGGPPTIFYFEATDEAWKGFDDGWGLWDESRTARYALCGTPVGPACSPDVYSGAGYYEFDAPPFETITFDDPDITYTLTGFAGAEDSQVVTDPAGGTNKVARVVRSAAAETFAGTVVSTLDNLSVGIVPFDAANTRMTVRVYSPDAGIKVRLKVENSGNSSQSVETDAVTTIANGWEMLTFDFANPAADTPPLNLSYDYDRVIIFFNFGVPGTTSGAKTYYLDDVAFIGGGGLPMFPFGGISFDAPGVVYTLTGFGGAEDSTLVADPNDGTNTAAKVVKSATAEVWAGTTVSTGPNLSAGKILFTATDTKMQVRVYSPRVGVVVRLKVEDAADGTRSVETEAVTTVADDWETLIFDFANEAAGTAPINLSYTYNKISIFFDFGTAGSDGGGGTFYFDDLLLVMDGDSGNTGTCKPPCIDFSSPDVKYTPFEGLVLAEQSDDPVDATNKVARFVKGPNGQPWAGATIYTIEATQSVPAFALETNKVVTLRVYAPAAGLTVRLKIEDASNPAVFLEQDALTTRADAWETLSFDFASAVGGSYDPASTYDRVSLFPVFSTTAPPASELTFYFDELQYTAVDDSGGSGGPLVFASGYASNNRTVEGGEWGFYSGNCTSYATTYAGGGFVDQAVPAEDSYVYLVITTSAPTTAGYMGIFTAAPGYTVGAPNAGVTLDGQATLKLELGMAAEWFQQAANKALTVQLIGTEVYSNGAGGECRILLDTPLTPTTADLITYSIDLAGMNLAQPCNGDGFNSGVSSVAEALGKPLAEIHVQAVFPQLNTTVLAGAEYPTGFTRGAAWFE
jgi:hypothetical protein